MLAVVSHFLGWKSQQGSEADGQEGLAQVWLSSIEIPILVCNLVNLLNTFFTLRMEEGVMKQAKVLIPQWHAETVDLSPCWLLGSQMIGLISSHRHLRVSRTIHWSLVYVGRSNDYVFIINCIQNKVLSLGTAFYIGLYG